MNGLEVLRAIRRSPVHERLPVVMMTSTADGDVVAQLIQLRVTDYLLKPITPAKLVDRLAAIVTSACVQPERSDSQASLDLRSTSQVLIVDERIEIRRLWMEQLRCSRRIDAVASAAEGLRRHQSKPYNVIFVGRAPGLLDGDALAEKLRDSRYAKGARVFALASNSEADDKRRSGLYDGVLLCTPDAGEMLTQLLRRVTPESAASLLMASTSPYVEAMFTKACRLLQEALRQDTMLTDAPPAGQDLQRWVSATIEIRSGRRAWRLAVTCPYVLGLAMAATSGGLERDSVSSVHVSDVLRALLSGIVEPVRAAFNEFDAECVVGAMAFEIVAASQVYLTAPDATALSRWFMVTGMEMAVLVRLVPRLN
jgi:CheY-like chemotaxis protein